MQFDYILKCTRREIRGVDWNRGGKKVVSLPSWFFGIVFFQSCYAPLIFYEM